ncbi:MAG: DUF4290 domain-containing protein [Bacteroidia bacterium]
MLHPPNPLPHTEYGSYLLRLIEKIQGLPTRAARNQAARRVIRWMAQLEGISPHKLEEQPILQKRLWENFASLGGAQLDIDFPFPIELKSEKHEVKKLLPPTRVITKSEGLLWPLFEKALADAPPQERKVIAAHVAPFLRQALNLSWEEVKAKLEDAWHVELPQELAPKSLPPKPFFPRKKHGRFSGRRR